MDFGLSEEQKLLESTLRRYLEEHAPVARVREWSLQGRVAAPELWRGLAELGAAGALVPQRFGGSELSMLDAALVAETLGYAAAPAPFLARGVLVPLAFLAAGSPAEQSAWLPRLAAGEARIGVALSELAARRDGAGVELRDGRLHGRALFALDAVPADAFLVAAGPDTLALVGSDAGGLALEELRTIDRTRRFAELGFAGVTPVSLLGGAGSARAVLARLLRAGRLALAADALGAAERALERAVAYARERRQFGRVIGSFQAVKHLCAEMAASLEPARSLLWYAAYAFDHADEREAERMALLAKSHLSEVCTLVARTAIEVHGGIGFTDEGELHLWFKRIALDRQLLGGPEQLRALVDYEEGDESPHARL